MTAHTIPLNSASPTWAAEARRASKAGIPVLMALIPLAMVLGAQAHQKGLSLVEVTLMTGLNYAGGSEFAAIGLWNSPLPVLLIVVMTFLANSRHLLMGAARCATSVSVAPFTPTALMISSRC